MKIHAILEIEEGSLTLTVADVGCRPMRIMACTQHKLPDVGRETVANVLRSLGPEPLLGAPGVHVVVGDRRALHLQCTIPLMPAADALGFLAREVSRAGGLQSAADAFLSARLLRSVPGGKLQLAASALPKSVWNPFAAAIADGGFTVLGLHTMEACLALAAAPDSRKVAVLECSVGRARFVACDGDAPVQVRRFMVGSGDVHSSALVAQLAIELPRTLEWLRESGLPAPSSVLYGNRLGIDEDGQAALRGEMERFEPAPLDARFAPDAVVPGLATLALLRRFAHGGAPTSLLEEPQLRVPWSRRKVGSFAALALVGAAMAWFGVGQGRGWLQARREHEVIATRAHEVEVRLAAASGLAAPGGETSVSADQLTRALGTRRPISRLIAEVSNAAGDEIGLDSLQFGGGDRVVVAGVVEAQSRSGALAALSAFTGKLRELAYVVADGQDEVTEVGGMPNVLRFKLGMAWRRS